jgi:hypothetical protein
MFMPPATAQPDQQQVAQCAISPDLANADRVIQGCIEIIQSKQALHGGTCTNQRLNRKSLVRKRRAVSIWSAIAATTSGYYLRGPVLAIKVPRKTVEYLELLCEYENIRSKSEAARMLMALGMQSYGRRREPLGPAA